MAVTDTKYEEQTNDRKKLLALLLLLMAEFSEELSGMAAGVAQGDLSPFQFQKTAPLLISAGHARAAFMGRQLAGSTTVFASADTDFGDSVAVEQEPFLEGFLNDLVDGKYEKDGVLRIDAITNRAEMYGKRLLGSANEAWALFLGKTLIYWMLGEVDPCDGCLELNANNPYHADTLPTYPGQSQTQCKFNCQCFLITDDGLKGFDLSE